MAKRYRKSELISRLQKRADEGYSLIMSGCGSGLSALSAEEAEVDLIAVYSTAVLRMRGLPSLIFTLPYYDANAITIDASEEITELVKTTPLIMGLGAHDPSVSLESLLDYAESKNYSGIMNEPFASIYGESFASRLESSGIGFSREVALIEMAAKRGLFTVAWAATPKEASVLAGAGANVIGAMILTEGPLFEGKQGEDWFDAAIDSLSAICDAAHSADPAVFVLSHGNAFHDPETARASVLRTAAAGYAAGSSGERVPAQTAISEIMRSYRNIRIKR